MDLLQKKIYEKIPVSIDFSPDLGTGETVSSFVVTCINIATGADSSSTIILSSTLATPIVTLVVQAGTTGEKHHIQVLATTNFTSSYDKDFILEIVDTTEGTFIKQPSDAHVIANYFTNMLATGETIYTHTVTAIKKSDSSDATSTIIYGANIDGSKILIGVRSGADGEAYQIVAKIVTSLGYQWQLDSIMMVREL